MLSTQLVILNYPINVIKIVYQTVRLITNRILGAKGLLRNRPLGFYQIVSLSVAKLNIDRL